MKNELSFLLNLTTYLAQEATEQKRLVSQIEPWVIHERFGHEANYLVGLLLAFTEFAHMLVNRPTHFLILAETVEKVEFDLRTSNKFENLLISDDFQRIRYQARATLDALKIPLTQMISPLRIEDFMDFEGYEYHEDLAIGLAEDGRRVVHILNWTDEVPSQLKGSDWVLPSDDSFVQLLGCSVKVKGLEIESMNPTSISELKRFTELERLRFSALNAFDFRKLAKLRDLKCECNEKTNANHFNRKGLEKLDLSGLQSPDLGFLSRATHIRAIRIDTSEIRSLSGINACCNLLELILTDLPQLNDISELTACEKIETLVVENVVMLKNLSPLSSLRNLRWLSIDAPSARLTNIDWVTDMPFLQSAALRVVSESINWNILATHPQLSDILIFVDSLVVNMSNDLLRDLLCSGGRAINQITRFPDSAHPAIRIQFERTEDCGTFLSLEIHYQQLRYQITDS